ncbi:MAG: tetratricopeptide repeat protein [Mailhella sp.]|nr:tetratricopeptide repeat protein [Mailhella sp.]
MNEHIAMASPLAGNGCSEKAKWYREVLSLDPDSRIFLPYARLLSELGRADEAVDVLKAGLSKHPEFLEARLYLIELLHLAGQDAAAGLEAEGIIDLLGQSPALWRIWSRRPGLRADQAAMLLFFAASMQKNGHSLADVFEAGIAALENGNAPQPAPSRQMQASGLAAGAAPEALAEDVQSAESPAEDKAFTMPEDREWYALDSVPDDDDIYDDEQAEQPVSALLFVQEAAQAAPAPQPEPDNAGYVPPMTTVPRGLLEGKSSLRTRSMARVLEEQGATDEAADIYRELLESCSSAEEEAELRTKLTSLLQNTENSASAQPSASGVLDMLEALAARLENRNRA